jgi:predicted AAA+ superfamily ATPase
MIEWKESSDRQPLLIEGARQVGKSFLIGKLFAPNHYKKILKLGEFAFICQCRGE